MAYNRFRTATPDADWRSLKTPVPSGASKILGDLYLINDIIGMAFYGEPYGVGDVIDKAYFVLVYNAEKILVKKATSTGSAFLAGEKVYWDSTDRLVYNANAATRTCCGFCTEPAADADELVEIDLKGDSMTDQA